MQKQNIITLSSKSKDFPATLLNLDQIPKSLNAVGNMELLTSNRPILGIVGSRKVTPYGREVTTEFARTTASRGAVIVSGLALGVDSLAHKAAIETNGATIAVLPSGIGKIYPSSHHGLARQIVDKNGLLASEYDYDFMPMRHSFIERNRIIAALSDVLLITEAAENSGSLHTARFALELGKTVAAVPGNITSAYSAGTNNLIRSGAIPIMDSNDLLELLNLDETQSEHAKSSYIPENDIESILIKLLEENSISGHELLEQSELETAVFQTHLTMLEIKGVIEPLGNNMWKLR